MTGRYAKQESDETKKGDATPTPGLIQVPEQVDCGII